MYNNTSSPILLHYVAALTSKERQAHQSSPAGDNLHSHLAGDNLHSHLAGDMLLVEGIRLERDKGSVEDNLLEVEVGSHPDERDILAGVLDETGILAAADILLVRDTLAAVGNLLVEDILVGADSRLLVGDILVGVGTLLVVRGMLAAQPI